MLYAPVSNTKTNHEQSWQLVNVTMQSEYIFFMSMKFIDTRKKMALDKHSPYIEIVVTLPISPQFCIFNVTENCTVLYTVANIYCYMLYHVLTDTKFKKVS